jgi:hypothetical protein
MHPFVGVHCDAVFALSFAMFFCTLRQMLLSRRALFASVVLPGSSASPSAVIRPRPPAVLRSFDRQRRALDDVLSDLVDDDAPYSSRYRQAAFEAYTYMLTDAADVAIMECDGEERDACEEWLEDAKRRRAFFYELLKDDEDESA